MLLGGWVVEGSAGAVARFVGDGARVGLVAGDGGAFGQVVARSGDMDYSVLGAGIGFIKNGGSCQRQRLGCTAVNWDGVRSGLARLARWLGSGLRCVSGASVELGIIPGTLCGRGSVQHGSTLSGGPEPPLGGAALPGLGKGGPSVRRWRGVSVHCAGPRLN